MLDNVSFMRYICDIFAIHIREIDSRVIAFAWGGFDVVYHSAICEMLYR